MRRRGKHNGCSVEAHHGHLRLRFRWQGRRYARATNLLDTPEHRARVQKLAGLVAATIAAGQDPLLLLEKASRRPEQTLPSGKTVAGYFDLWVADKLPPMVRKAQARDYRRHIGGYVLSRLGATPVAELTPRDILGLRAELLQRGLSLKYVKNILAGSFKAMIRDAREIDGLLERDPFLGVRWGRVQVAGPEPFTAGEVRGITHWFSTKRFGLHSGRAADGPRLRVHPPYHAFVHTLFWTGMRPSEAAGLHWGDVDLERRVLRVVRSRHMGEESAPKTGQAARTVELLPESVRLLRLIEPLRVTPSMPVFTHTGGGAIEPKAFSTHWYRCLRGLGIRVRGLYATKDTYISVALSAGVKIPWLEAQTGVRYETLRRHYGTWLRAEGGDQLEKLARLAPNLAPRGTDETQVVDISELEKCEEGDLNPHGFYPTSPSN
jgi:integrase